MESERSTFLTTLKRKITFETIARDQHLRLTEEQKKDVKEELKKKKNNLIRKDYVFTAQIFQSTLKTPGEARPANRAVLESGIREGVRIRACLV